ncbi:nuclear transport factor 2 family protein [Catenuloplanes japonicus]|uniref:nuclear transport factor 2 family protein n=1 Tax=Catenuloplanes japonicus TaxID=33876 RepID=UPI00052799C4|nr:nuclear transport factor 2 family protein [Catenuloplanes japonicus]
MSDDLERRVRTIEDRYAISEVIVRYAVSIDRRDWDRYATCFTGTLHVDFSEAGMPAADLTREQFVDFSRAGLGGWTATQHLSPNHVITFDEADPDRAVCESAMYARHHMSDTDRDFVMRGAYTSHLVRTADGWRIERLIQHLGWADGDPAVSAQQ